MLCCNHLITKDIKLEPKGKASWQWVTAADYTDPEGPQKEHFAIKFKTQETADEFKKIFLDCQTRGIQIYATFKVNFLLK